MKLKLIIGMSLIMTMGFCTLALAVTNADLTDKLVTEQIVLYQPSEVKEALRSIKPDAKYSKLLEDVLIPASMEIQTPNIDVSEISNNQPIAELDEVFVDSLVKNGIEPKKAESMTFSEFQTEEARWQLSDEDKEIAKRLFPELRSINMDNWTYGKYKAYYTRADRENLKNRFTKSQLKELNDRGIRVEDTHCLFKEFHDPETILSQTDENLKKIIEGYYQLKLHQVDGILIGEQKMSIASAPPLDKYTWVEMPRYGGDYFLNSVLTTEYWRNVQADRALRTQQVLYNSTSATLYCTNMYGTYSQSQRGAHEGIDFANGRIRTIYAPFRGTVLSGGLSHQLAVYDVNAPETSKTYSFLHMNSKSKTPGATVQVYNSVGEQGNKGNTAGQTGYHVHFEVHSGSTTGLSLGNDHVLGSISPYQLQSYIGEL